MTEPIRALLLEDDTGDARLLELGLLVAAPGEFQVTRVQRLEDALQRLGNEPFDVIVSDLNVPDSSGLATFTRMQTAAPGIPIVLLSSNSDVSLAVKAVNKGAQDYMVKSEMNGERIARSLRYAIERSKTQGPNARSNGRSTKVLTFIGAKGGIGTSTVALNVATVLALQNKRVIAVELNSSYGTFSAQLKHPALENLSHILASGPNGVNEQGVSERLSILQSGLRVLFGPQKFDQFAEINSDQAGCLIDELCSMADYVVIDLPSHPTEAGRAVTSRSNFTGLVVERDPVCTMAGKRTREMLRSWGAADTRIGAIVVSSTSTVSPMKLSDLGALLDCHLAAVIPPALDACLRAEWEGAPVVISQPETLVAKAFEELANKLSVDSFQLAVEQLNTVNAH